MANNLHDDTKRGNADIQVDRALAAVQQAMLALKEAESALQNATSIFDGKGDKGCTWDKRNNSWKVRASVNGRVINVGNYRRLVDAKAAYDRAKQSSSRD